MNFPLDVIWNSLKTWTVLKLRSVKVVKKTQSTHLTFVFWDSPVFCSKMNTSQKKINQYYK